jgi:predicted DNA-binding transcriptional regulator AlpA
MEVVPSLARRKIMHETTSQKVPTTEYLSINALSDRIGYAVKTIYNLVSRDIFKEGVHYFKPTKRKLLFYWPAIEQWIREDRHGN